jgi:LCP family protein required for cell wall assembly
MVMGGKRRSSGTGADEPTARSPRRHRGRLAAWTAIVTVAVLVLTVAGYAVFQYERLDHGIQRSDVLQRLRGSTAVKSSTNQDTNILIMGLDSRLDENGNLLPPAIYAALNAGDSSSGGENANVLMLLHVPGDGSKATAISIPRDDYVSLPGCPDGECHGKIKQAYGLALDQEAKKLVHSTSTGKTPLIQQERDAGRQAEIATVSQFLGGVPIDHFVEVTMVGFFQIAQVVQPIAVCLKEDTQDSYSGAKFHAGLQQIDAAQAVAFVRQRRDNVHPDLNFTDLDRSRRQQAFIASLAYQLKQADTLTNPGKLSGILDVAKQNVAVDSALNLLTFAEQASGLTGGNITFYTLPIDHFGSDPLGESVNIVNLPLIQSTVRSLLQGPRPAAGATSPTTRPSPTPAPATAVPATGGGRSGPAPTQLSALSGGGIPCVK